MRTLKSFHYHLYKYRTIIWVIVSQLSHLCSKCTLPAKLYNEYRQNISNSLLGFAQLLLIFVFTRKRSLFFGNELGKGLAKHDSETLDNVMRSWILRKNLSLAYPSSICPCEAHIYVAVVEASSRFSKAGSPTRRTPVCVH